jgi:hypothetical protein
MTGGQVCDMKSICIHHHTGFCAHQQMRYPYIRIRR